MERYILFIEQCLKKYKYPNIYGADLAEILGGPNRLFLLSWLYKIILGEENADEPTIEALTEFLNAYGFCSTSQTQNFIAMSLDYPTQIKIFCRIFKILSTVENECQYPESFDELSIDIVEDFLQIDVNIFRSFGHLKISNNLHEECITNNTSKNITFNEGCERVENLSDVKEKIDRATDIITILSRHVDTNDVNIFDNEKDIKCFAEFNEKVSKAKENIENIQTMAHLKDGIIFEDIIIPEEKTNEYTGMAKEIIRLINEI